MSVLTWGTTSWSALATVSCLPSLLYLWGIERLQDAGFWRAACDAAFAADRHWGRLLGAQVPLTRGAASPRRPALPSWSHSASSQAARVCCVLTRALQSSENCFSKNWLFLFGVVPPFS